MFGRYARCLLANTGSWSNMTVQFCMNLGADMYVTLEAVNISEQQDCVQLGVCISVSNRRACLYSKDTSH